MIDFHDITVRDQRWIEPILHAANKPGADYTFTSMLFWTNYYGQVGRVGDFVTQYLHWEGRNIYLFPAGQGDLRAAVDAVLDDSLRRGGQTRFRGVTADAQAFLEEQYPGRFRFTPYRDSFDYIYTVEELTELHGKKLQAKRNHCNRFEAEYDWRFVPMTRELIPACMDMLSVWSEDNAARLDPSIAYEHDAIIRAFAAFEQLGLEGGVLYANGEIMGFTMGEFASRDTFDVHFEKARVDINGAYPMVCRELTRMLMAKHPNLKYMNREDDMGLESLRTSKLSYKPEYLLKKYTARWIDE